MKILATEKVCGTKKKKNVCANNFTTVQTVKSLYAKTVELSMISRVMANQSASVPTDLEATFVKKVSTFLIQLFKYL